MQMLCRVKDQGRVEDGEPERREDLNEEQRGRSLRSLGEAAFEKFDPALLCRSTRRLMSSILYVSEDYAVVAGVPPSRLAVAAGVPPAGFQNCSRHGCLYSHTNDQGPSASS